MGTLQDALKGAVAAGAGGTALQAEEPAPAGAPVGVAALPRPEGTPWAEWLRRAGQCPPPGAPVAAFVQKTAALVKDLERGGRGREARELAHLRDEFLRLRERRAWEGVKARFAELELPEKAYRAIKQEGVEPERVLARLHTRRAEGYRGLAAAKLRDQLLEK